MPEAYIKKIAKYNNVATKEIEKYWDKAKNSVPDDKRSNYQYIMGTFQKIITNKGYSLPKKTVERFNEVLDRYNIIFYID